MKISFTVLVFFFFNVLVCLLENFKLSSASLEKKEGLAVFSCVTNFSGDTFAGGTSN